MTLPVSPLVLQLASIAAVMFGTGWVVYASLAGDTVLRRFHRRYTLHLDRTLKLIFLEGSGARIFVIQAVVAGLVTAVALWFGLPLLYLVLPVVFVAPAVVVERKRRQHVKQLEGQTDGLILALANALKTVPSPAAALESLVPVLPKPMQQEIDRLMKEVKIGSTLEQALLNMSSRLKSPDIDAALSALLIGLQVGGNLPMVLEDTAGTIREMARLQGVIRTKTADARAQLWVLALFPFVICYAFTLLDPQFFWPLEQTFVGNLVTAVALTLWIVSLVTARKVLKVDI